MGSYPERYVVVGGDLTHLVVRHVMGWLVHDSQHGYPACAEKANDEDGCQQEEDDIENAGIVPLHSFCDRHHIAVLWYDAERLDQELDDVARGCHRDVECQQDVAHDAPAIIFAVNVKNGQDNQVGKNETDHTTKADAASPQDSR